MKLLIVESPSKAKTIGKYLGKDYRVISSYGHIRGLPSKEGAVLPDEHFKMIYEVDIKSKKHVAEILKAVQGCEEILLATDPDREGEAISWHIMQVLAEKKVKIPQKRVVFYEITKKSVLQAIENAREIDDNLVKAQQARQALDYLYGYTLSPVLWRKLPGAKSAGRVQSVALKIICEREDEIEKFKSQEYWSITAQVTNTAPQFEAQVFMVQGKKLEKFDINNSASAQKLVEFLQAQEYHIETVEKKEVRRNPHPPFTTSTLLQDASRKFGFSAKKTALIAQKLYEGIDLGGETAGLITYMRTDSVNLSFDAIEAARHFISKTYGEKFLPEKARVYKTKAKNAQEAHEAIRPTDVAREPSRIRQYLDADQFKLYDLIWKRMVACQMEPAVFDQKTITITDKAAENKFRATGSTLKFTGYLEVYNIAQDDDEEDEENKKLPEVKEGALVTLDKITPFQHFTEPPPRYSEASLVKKMEELGIGRPSTYPSIISVIQDREYVKLDKKRFFPESRGRVVSSFLDNFFTRYVAYDFTANLENELDHVANGETIYLKVLEAFWHDFKRKTEEVIGFKNSDILIELQKSLQYFVFGDEKERDCPKCKDGKLQLKMSKFGLFISCSNYPECDHRSNISHGEHMEPSADAEASGKGGATDLDGLPKTLGEDARYEAPIMLKKGPYGLYVETQEVGKVKRSSVPKNINQAAVTLELALGLLSFPKVLGKHPSTHEDIIVNRGRFGPYVGHKRTFVSLKKIDPLAVTFDQALAMIEEKEAGTTVT